MPSEATCYSRVGIVEADSMNRTVRDALTARNVANAVRAIVKRGDNPNASSFERYASTLVRNAGGPKLAKTRQANGLRIIPPENGQLAKIIHTGGFTQSMLPVLLSVECAINRLICIRDAISDGLDERDPPQAAPRRSISLLGGGYLASPSGWRSTRVKLPSLASVADVTPSYYNEVDWRCTDCVASNARAVFQRSLRPNPYRIGQVVTVADKSDWDVRTRLAQILRALELPHRYSFRFDYDHRTKAVETAFTCPPAEFLPAIIASGHEGAPPSKTSAHEAYLIRLACLMGAACFGSGRAIETCIVVGYDASWNQPLVSVQFSREEFVKSVLTSVDSNDIAEPALRFLPNAIACMIGARTLDWYGNTGDNEKGPVTLPMTSVISMRVKPWQDDRKLSDGARKLFHAKRICDIDTAHYFGGYEDEVRLARDDAQDSTLAAALRLESLIETLEHDTVPPDDDASARPLYAPNALSRLSVTLIDDEMSIADQAEAYLQGDCKATTCGHGNPSYFRAPDALFHAHFGLSDLYQRMGDYQGALLHADRCLALGPTTASAYCRKADILAGQGLLTQAANVIASGLRVAASSIDSALLYYHLGMFLWKLGKPREAFSVHTYNASLRGEYAILSSRAATEILKNDASLEDVPKTSFAASQELKALHIPIAPVNMRNLIAQATILLANSGSPLAAAPYASEFERLCNNDEIIIATCQSIQFGVIR